MEEYFLLIYLLPSVHNIPLGVEHARAPYAVSTAVENTNPATEPSMFSIGRRIFQHCFMGYTIVKFI